MNFENKNVAVVGLGIEGKDAVQFLLKEKAKVTLFDQKTESELDFSGVDKKKLSLVCGPDYLKNGFVGFDYIIRSPGIRPDIPEFVEAKKRGAVITSDIKIFFDLCPAKIIGVTGTKGKGTTSTLIYEILKADSTDVYLAGNIGKPCLELLPKITKDSYLVLELSSFQLFDLDKSPNIAVVLNITVDHLDWHTNREEYVDAKKNIVSHQTKSDFAVINAEYETSKNFEEITKAKVILFSKKTLKKKYKENILLKGEHNLENIAAAVEVGKILKTDEDKILRTVRSFKGLEHRLELVKEISGVSFYNDSFSTNPQTTIAAIKSFSETLTLILGGSDKGLDYDEMAKEIVTNGNVQNVILIGQIAPIIKKSLEKVKYSGKIFDLGMTTMKNAVETSFRNSQTGGVILLSPATASFGMFQNYKDRGNQFKEEVWKLKN